MIKKTDQQILRAQAREDAAVTPIMLHDPSGSTECVDGFICVVKQANKMHLVLVGTIVGVAHSVHENAALDSIDSVWLVNDHVDFDTNWTVY